MEQVPPHTISMFYSGTPATSETTAVTQTTATHPDATVPDNTQAQQVTPNTTTADQTSTQITTKPNVVQPDTQTSTNVVQPTVVTVDTMENRPTQEIKKENAPSTVQEVSTPMVMTTTREVEVVKRVPIEEKNECAPKTTPMVMTDNSVPTVENPMKSEECITNPSSIAQETKAQMQTSTAVVTKMPTTCVQTTTTLASIQVKTNVEKEVKNTIVLGNKEPLKRKANAVSGMYTNQSTKMKLNKENAESSNSTTHGWNFVRPKIKATFDYSNIKPKVDTNLKPSKM